MKYLVAILFVCVAVYVIAGTIGLPRERMVVPPPAGGTNTVFVFDYEACTWSKDTYTENSYEFQVPAWNHWYWIGIWEEEELVFCKWIGHFITYGDLE